MNIILKNYGFESKRSNRHGSLIHKYWKYRIGRFYEKKGFDVIYDKSTPLKKRSLVVY